MCGVIGVAGEHCPDKIRAVIQRIAHRGPDDSGVYADDRITLGHCRLAIIDPQHGRQPFTTENGRYVLSYNGEIYNFRELAERLRARGVTIRSSSDTETLAYWFQEFGLDGLAELDGMFAFAIWDRQDQRLVLARDRFGMKPMYVANQGGKLVFGSEIKAMLPWIQSGPNPRAIAQFLTYQNVLTQDTFFAGVEKLEPGRWLEWRPGGIRSGAFWSLAFPDTPREIALDDAAEEFTSLFDASVKRHLISDVPVGSYLSGGIDSASVATKAAGFLDAAYFPTFTGAFTDRPYYDERDGARAVAGAIGADFKDVEITPDMFESSLSTVMWHLDEPTLGTGAVPQYIVSQLAAQHVRVVLTGHGGDELFAGYQVNKAFRIKNALRSGPLEVFRALTSARPDELTRILYFLLFPLVQPEVGAGIFVMTPRRRWTHTAGPALREGLERDYVPTDTVKELFGNKGYSPAEKLFALYLRTYLPTLFIQEDKVGMAHSIEARMPICGNDLLAFGTKIGLNSKLAGGALKAIPRAAARQWLPEMIFDLPKRGFPTPLARWFRTGRLKDMIQDLVASKQTAERGFINTRHAQKLLDANTRSSTDTLADYARANKLYSLAMVELWFRTFMDDPAPTGPVDLSGRPSVGIQ
tara:strand:+ start:130529 stop:132445 length:1917 start_codon:yes stop_codon:yes gene_type:complete